MRYPLWSRRLWQPIADGEKPLAGHGFGEYGRVYTGREVVQDFDCYVDM